MLPPEKSLKILLKEPKIWSQPYKNILEKQTQIDILSQSKNKVKINEIAANISDLEINGLEIVQSITIAS